MIKLKDLLFEGNVQKVRTNSLDFSLPVEMISLKRVRNMPLSILKKPITVNGNKVVDGNHRLAKAIMEEEDYILADVTGDYSRRYKSDDFEDLEHTIEMLGYW